MEYPELICKPAAGEGRISALHRPPVRFTGGLSLGSRATVPSQRDKKITKNILVTTEDGSEPFHST